jgi:hypothetical protein
MGILANPNRRNPKVASAFSESNFRAQFLMAVLTVFSQKCFYSRIVQRIKWNIKLFVCAGTCLLSVLEILIMAGAQAPCYQCKLRNASVVCYLSFHPNRLSYC